MKTDPIDWTEVESMNGSAPTANRDTELMVAAVADAVYDKITANINERMELMRPGSEPVVLPSPVVQYDLRPDMRPVANALRQGLADLRETILSAPPPVVENEIVPSGVDIINEAPVTVNVDTAPLAAAFDRFAEALAASSARAEASSARTNVLLERLADALERGDLRAVVPAAPPAEVTVEVDMAPIAAALRAIANRPARKYSIKEDAAGKTTLTEE